MARPPRLPDTAQPLVVFIRPVRVAGAARVPALPGGARSRPEPGEATRVPLLTAAPGHAPAVPRAVPASPGAGKAASRPTTADLPRAPELDADGLEAGDGALDAEGLRQYRVSLGGAMRNSRPYPALAQERGWQGRVKLLLNLVRGKPPRVLVEKSSGFPLLDTQAREMLQGAAAVTPLPPSLGSRDFALPLTVVFDLEDQ